MKTFKQQPYELNDLYGFDTSLKAIMSRSVTNKELLEEMERELDRFGRYVVSKEVLSHAASAEQPENWPRLRNYDAWNNRIDELQLHEVRSNSV